MIRAAARSARETEALAACSAAPKPPARTIFGANACNASFLPSRSVAANASSRIARTRAPRRRASPGAAPPPSRRRRRRRRTPAAAEGGAPQRRVRRARVDGERSLRDARGLLRVPALERARADVHQALELDPARVRLGFRAVERVLVPHEAQGVLAARRRSGRRAEAAAAAPCARALRRSSALSSHGCRLMYASLGSVRGASPLSPVPPPPALNRSRRAFRRRRAPARGPRAAAGRRGADGGPPAMAGLCRTSRTPPRRTRRRCPRSGSARSRAARCPRRRDPSREARSINRSRRGRALVACAVATLSPRLWARAHACRPLHLAVLVRKRKCVAAGVAAGAGPVLRLRAVHGAVHGAAAGSAPAARVASASSSRTPPTVLVLPVAQSQRRAVKTLFCMLCAWQRPPSACRCHRPASARAAATLPCPTRSGAPPARAARAAPRGSPGRRPRPRGAARRVRGRGNHGTDGPGRGGVPRGHGFGRRGTRTRWTGRSEKASGCFPSSRARGAFSLPRSRREAHLRVRALRMRAAASVRAVVHDAPASNPDSPERRPATPVDAGRRTRECAIRRKALPRKSAGDFSARKIAGKNARAPTCVFCVVVCVVMVAESRVSLVRLFARSCSKNRQRGPTFDLGSTVCSQVLSRHRSRKARRLVRPPPPRMETLCR